jgi:Methyltransferase FkbM domain
MIEVIHEHSLRTDLLRPGGWVLDGGCRDFAFAGDMLLRGLRVAALDPSRDVGDPGRPGIAFRPWALVGHPRPEPQSFVEAGNGSRLTSGPWATQASCVTIEALMTELGVPFWEAVKLDVEGAEYEILRNWPGPVARQITVEFHDFNGGATPGTASATHAEILAHLGRWYEVAQHAWETRHGAGYSFWDSLFILKEQP